MIESFIGWLLLKFLQKVDKNIKMDKNENNMIVISEKLPFKLAGIALGYYVFVWREDATYTLIEEIKHVGQQYWFYQNIYLKWVYIPTYLIVTGVQMLFGVPYSKTVFEKHANGEL